MTGDRNDPKRYLSSYERQRLRELREARMVYFAGGICMGVILCAIIILLGVYA